MRDNATTAGEAASLTGAALEQALATGRFEQSAAHLTGMVKPSGKPGHIAFTPSGCDSWVDLPTNMIETAEHIGRQTCRDHSHPLFQLTLKEPKDPQAKLLLALVAAGQRMVMADQWEMPGDMPHGRMIDMQRIGSAGEVDMVPGQESAPTSFSARMIDDQIGDLGGGLSIWHCKDRRCCRCTQRAFVTLPGRPGGTWVCFRKECGTCRDCTWTPW